MCLSAVSNAIFFPRFLSDHIIFLIVFQSLIRYFSKGLTVAFILFKTLPTLMLNWLGYWCWCFFSFYSVFFFFWYIYFLKGLVSPVSFKICDILSFFILVIRTHLKIFKYSISVFQSNMQKIYLQINPSSKYIIILIN